MFSLLGIDHFHLKSFSFQELKLPVENENRKYTVDVVEMYFHIFGVPVFSLGKRTKLSWYGDLSEIPAHLQNKIDHKILKEKGKWYSFTGMYFIILTLAFIGMEQRIAENERLEKRQKYDLNQQEFANNPQVGDRYYFKTYEGETFEAEIHQIHKSKLIFTVQLLAETKTQDNPGTKEEQLQKFISTQERLNFLEDSLQSVHPKEPLLRNLEASHLLNKEISYIQVPIDNQSIRSCIQQSRKEQFSTLSAFQSIQIGSVILDRIGRE